MGLLNSIPRRPKEFFQLLKARKRWKGLRTWLVIEVKNARIAGQAARAKVLEEVLDKLVELEMKR